MDKHRIAFLGTGLMGVPMAANLLRAGHELRVWNRTAGKAVALAEQGARICDDPAQALEGAEMVVSMMSDGAAVAQVQRRCLAAGAVRASMLWIDMSSVRPGEARAQAAALDAAGARLLDAPVSGGTRGAEAARLAIMVGGDQRDFDRAAPVLRAMGRPVLVGPTGAGQLAKLANQAIVGITIGAVAEATLMLQRGGADPAAARRALAGGFADSLVLQQHGARMSDGDFTPGGTCRTQLKDMRNILAEAAELGLALPLSQQIEARYAALCDAPDRAELDHAALYLELGDRNPGGAD